jgi:hypothetical protein
VLGATKDIEFVAGQNLPEDSTFDERTQDLRFSGEEGDREEDELEESVPDEDLPGEIVIRDDELEGNEHGGERLGERARRAWP